MHIAVFPRVGESLVSTPWWASAARQLEVTSHLAASGKLVGLCAHTLHPIHGVEATIWISQFVYLFTCLFICLICLFVYLIHISSPRIVSTRGGGGPNVAAPCPLYCIKQINKQINKQTNGVQDVDCQGLVFDSALLCTWIRTRSARVDHCNHTEVPSICSAWAELYKNMHAKRDDMSIHRQT